MRSKYSTVVCNYSTKLVEFMDQNRSHYVTTMFLLKFKRFLIGQKGCNQCNQKGLILWTGMLLNKLFLKVKFQIVCIGKRIIQSFTINAVILKASILCTVITKKWSFLRSNWNNLNTLKYFFKMHHKQIFDIFNIKSAYFAIINCKKIQFIFIAQSWYS